MTKQENRQIKLLIKQRILEYVQSQGISLYSFYKNSGITRNTFSTQSGISESNLMKFRQYAPEVSLHWLVEGEGGMFEQWTPVGKVDPEMIRDLENIHYEPGAHLQMASDVNLNYQVSCECEKDVCLGSKGIPLYELEYKENLIEFFSRRARIKSTEQLIIPGAPACDGAIRIQKEMLSPLKRGDILFYRKCDMSDAPDYDRMYLLLCEKERKKELVVGKLLPGSMSEWEKVGEEISSVTLKESVSAVAKIVGCVHFDLF